MCPAKTAEPIEMLFGEGADSFGPRNHVFDGSRLDESIGDCKWIRASLLRAQSVPNHAYMDGKQS